MKLITLLLVLGLTSCAGPRGNDGTNGLDGDPGAPGLNGSNGLDAPPTPYTPVALVNPCGDAPGIADEVFIQMANGQLVVSFSDSASGQNTRFAILMPGNYQTTDGDHCTFTLSADGTISNENHHY